ncbi:hypothetical protein HAX54_028423, partial [Datura stramonium]|nr:hypothetical protein [Datura stramonium]
IDKFCSGLIGLLTRLGHRCGGHLTLPRSRRGGVLLQNAECCINASYEDEDHLFCKGNISRKVWKHFSQIMGINFDQEDKLQ